MGVHAGEIVAPAYGFATNYVADGQTDVQSDRVIVAYDGTVYKQGEGQWMIPLSYLMQPWTATFGVMDGTLSFGLGSAAGSYTAPTTIPASISDKALIWVDANDDTKVVRDGSAVSAWYDHRESDIASPQYVWASTYTGYTNEAPEYTTLDSGEKTVYFGQFASGRSMKFVNPNGTDCTSHTAVDKAVKQVFAVICNSNSYGNVFGTYSSYYDSPFRISHDTSAANSIQGFYFYSASSGNQGLLNEKMIHGRAYLNGARIDPTMKVVEKGLQLLEAEAKAITGASLVSGFFAGSKKSYSGGDYLCEAIAFTNCLTEVERLAVEEYLMAKWLPQKGKHRKNVRLAAGAAYSANVASGESAETQLALSGTGTAEKTGDGDLILRNSSSADGVVWDVKGGSLTLGAFAPIKAAAGQNVTVANLVAGPKVTIASGDADVLEKSGNDMLTVNGVPSGVKRIRVSGGTLAVRSPRDPVPAESVHEVPVRNGNFEEYAAVIATLRADTERNENIAISQMIGYGWDRPEGAAYVFDYDGWRGSGKGSLGATRSAYNITTRPPAGGCALFMLCKANTQTTVRSENFTLAETGDYELRFKMCGRQNGTYSGSRLRVSMIGSSNTTSYGPVYYLRYTYIDGYLEYSLRFPSLAAGGYRINFFLAKGFDGAVAIDDVHLYKVPTDPLAAAKWKIPGGDFEAQTLPLGLSSRTFSADNTLDGWTFTQPASWSKSLPAVGVSTLAMTNVTPEASRGFLYNNSREPEYGSMQLCFCGNGTAETAITPPAGTYRLEGFLSKFGSYGIVPSLSASIIRQNETVIDLGSLTPGNKMMKRVGWPNVFTVDGSETVTLRLTASGTNSRVDHFATGILLDDVELVTATDRELFKDGDCETAGGTALKSFAASAFGCARGQTRFRTDTEAPSAFGSEMVDGHKMIAIETRSYLYEDVTLPFAGRYRLSFYTKSRLNAKSGDYGPNPLEVTVNNGITTNILGRVNTYNSGWTQRVFDFNVPSSGVYRVAFQGLSTNGWQEAHIDSISLKQVHEARDLTPPFDPKTCIEVAEGARLETDFVGTNTIRSLRLGNVRCTGFVSPADYPEYLSGTGTFKIVPRGASVSFR